jgi:hypothetical protein
MRVEPSLENRQAPPATDNPRICDDMLGVVDLFAVTQRLGFELSLLSLS